MKEEAPTENPEPVIPFASVVHADGTETPIPQPENELEPSAPSEEESLRGEQEMDEFFNQPFEPTPPDPNRVLRGMTMDSVSVHDPRKGAFWVELDSASPIGRLVSIDHATQTATFDTGKSRFKVSMGGPRDVWTDDDELLAEQNFEVSHQQAWKVENLPAHWSRLSFMQRVHQAKVQENLDFFRHIAREGIVLKPLTEDQE